MSSELGTNKQNFLKTNIEKKHNHGEENMRERETTMDVQGWDERERERERERMLPLIFLVILSLIYMRVERLTRHKNI